MRKALEELLDVIQCAIDSGDWKIDGACDPDSAIVSAKKALAQPEQEPLNEWQLIETAPKSNLLKPEHRLMLWVEGVGIAFGYAYDNGCGGVFVRPEGYAGTWKVTHWMPIPSKPSIEAAHGIKE